jgi:gamma-glutamylcyclotransferase (GGCT)/AIG2-like uncharacterized protein YtfP
MSNEQTHRLFSYGTLQQKDVQLSTFGRCLSGSSDAMPGYTQSMIEITDPEVIAKSGARFHTIAVPSNKPDDEVPGKVFEITDSELAAADEYEVGDYKRISVRLRSGVSAWVYVKA